MNSVHIIGRVCNDVELRYTPSQMAVVKLNVAVDDGYGEKKKTYFIPITVFGKQAENCEKFVSKGKKIAVVSNKFYDATQALCKHFFGDLVDVAIGEREDIRKKPAPDTVMAALKQLQASREGAVYIGDSDVDIMTARNCEMPCISVLWGFRDYDFLIEHGASILITNPLQLR